MHDMCNVGEAVKGLLIRSFANRYHTTKGSRTAAYESDH